MKNTGNTIRKNIILDWLYSTDMHVSLEKLGSLLEQQTNGQYKLINTGDNTLPSAFDNQLEHHSNSCDIEESK